MGAVNDERTLLLLDTGANTSAISESFARKRKLRGRMSTKKQIDVQGIGKSKVVTMSRVTVNVTLGWKVVYNSKYGLCHITQGWN